MTPRLLVFILAQAAVTFLANSVDHSGSRLFGCVFQGVLSAQFALVGLWIGGGDRPKATRFTIAAACVLGLCAAATARNAFSPWELLMDFVRLFVLGAAFWKIRERDGLVIKRTTEGVQTTLFTLTLKHLFVVTFATAAFLALMRVLERHSGPMYELLLVAAVITIGLASALVPLFASISALSKPSGNTAVSIAIILLVASLLGWFGYAQTDSWLTGTKWFARTIVEAVATAISIIAIRIVGYRLTPAASS